MVLTLCSVKVVRSLKRVRKKVRDGESPLVVKLMKMYLIETDKNLKYIYFSTSYVRKLRPKRPKIGVVL